MGDEGSIDWDLNYFVCTFIHKGCGGELKFIATVGVDVREAISVEAFGCEKCGRVVTNLEDKKEFERRYERREIDAHLRR